MPSRGLVRICTAQPGEQVRKVLDVLATLALQLSEGAIAQLLDQAEPEMTVRGWNQRRDFAQSARAAVGLARRQALAEKHRLPMAEAGALTELSTDLRRHGGHEVA